MRNCDEVERDANRPLALRGTSLAIPRDGSRGEARRARHQLRPHAYGRPAARRWPSIPTPRSPASSIRTAAGWRRAIANFGIPEDRVFTDLETCLSQTKADLAIVCSATAEHADYVEKIAPHGLNVMVEKPFAASVADARRMIAAMAGDRPAPRHQLAARLVSARTITAKRLIDEGAIGDLIEVHFYDGNRGPLFHLADKVEVSPRGGRGAEAELLVVQEGGRRRQPARLSRLRRDARHLVHERRGAARGDLRRRRDAGHRGRPAFDHRLPLRARPVEIRDALGHLHRPVDACSRSRNAASCWSAPTAPSPATTTTTSSRCRRAQAPAHDAGRRRTRCRRAGARRSNTCSPASRTARRSPGRSTRRSAWSASGSSTAPCFRRATKRTVALVRMSETPDLDAYALKSAAAAEVAAPDLPYRPPMPQSLSAAHRAGRRRRHFGGASRRLPRRRASTSR